MNIIEEIQRIKKQIFFLQRNTVGAGSTAWADITGKPAAVTSLSGTNTGDNATNSQYSGLATSKTEQYQVRRMIRR